MKPGTELGCGLLLGMTLFTGCKDALDVYESKAAPAVMVAANTNGGLTLTSRGVAPGGVLVTGAVQRVELPWVNSPDIAGDRASCIVLVPVDAIPAHPGVRRVDLHYDNHGWLQGIRAGTQLVLRFQKDGGFDGAIFPPSSIAANGAASGGEAVRSETNRTSAAVGARP